MLGQFVDLYDLPDRKIFGYAKVWGPLRLCQHNLPHQHGRLEGTPESLLKKPPSNLDFIKRIQHHSRSGTAKSICMPLFWEPIETWRFFSRQANAMLRIAANLNIGMPGHASDWDCVLAGGLPFYNASIAKPAELNLHRNLLLTALRAWMGMSRFNPWIVNLEGRIYLGQADLCAKLSLELALAISRVKVPAVCSVCGGQYDAIRKPSTGRLHYCSNKNCQREGARRRKARSRQKKLE